MSITSFFALSITFLVLILSVESVYHVYTYDDGHGNDEHCCLVRVRENFCLATPITRSLIQVDKQCYQLNRSKRRRFGSKRKNRQYLNKISRRLNVQAVRDTQDVILLQLKTPLDQTVLKNDLICLESKMKNVDLDQCYLELTNPLESSRKRRRQNERRRKYILEGEKRIIVKNETTDQSSDIDIESEDEIYRLELNQPVRISEGSGLFIQQALQLNLKNIQPIDRLERQCWQWYRKYERRARRDLPNGRSTCTHLDDHRERCIHYLIHSTSDKLKHGQSSLHQPNIGAITMDSKLFCKNNEAHPQMIGTHRRSKICFENDHRIVVEHRFNDIAHLSDKQKNKDTLTWIKQHPKLQAELENDCLNHTSLHEPREPVNIVRA